MANGGGKIKIKRLQKGLQYKQPTNTGDMLIFTIWQLITVS